MFLNFLGFVFLLGGPFSPERQMFEAVKLAITELVSINMN